MAFEIAWFKNLLKLPPVEKRRDISRSWLNKLTFLGRLSREKNDSYIYWRCYIISIFVTIAYTVLYQLNFFYDLGFPIQMFHYQNEVLNFCYNFSFVLMFPLTAFTAIYGLLLMQANVDLKHTDLTWWESESFRQKMYYKWGDKYAQRNVKIRFWIVVIALPFLGAAPTRHLSRYSEMEFSDFYQILIGVILNAVAIVLLSIVPYITAQFYQLCRGWFVSTLHDDIKVTL